MKNMRTAYSTTPSTTARVVTPVNTASSGTRWNATKGTLLATLRVGAVAGNRPRLGTSYRPVGRYRETVDQKGAISHRGPVTRMRRSSRTSADDAPTVTWTSPGSTT